MRSLFTNGMPLVIIKKFKCIFFKRVLKPFILFLSDSLNRSSSQKEAGRYFFCFFWNGKFNGVLSKNDFYLQCLGLCHFSKIADVILGA